MCFNLVAMENNDMIVFVDKQTIIFSCTKGQALCGSHAVVDLPPLQGKNLKVEIAVISEIIVILYQTQHGSMMMDVSRDFM